MLWPGTIVGATVGYVLANIPGAMLGSLLGQALDRRLQLQSWADLRDRLKGQATLRNDELLFVMLGRLAKANGQVVEAHIRQARQEMSDLGMSGPAQRRGIGAFNRGRAGSDKLRVHMRRFTVQPHAAEGVLRACWRMIWADGRAGRRECELLVSWGEWMGWQRERVLALSSDHEPQRRSVASSGFDYEQAMRILGVTAATEPDEVKRAYRRLLSRHHPDKLVGNGATPAQLREATERTRELHGAYALIKERRSIR